MGKKAKSFLDIILEEFGEKILDEKGKKIESISTGCLSLDTSIGIGGIPKGAITTMFGPEGSGKTTIALNTAKQVANSGRKALYIEVENLLTTETLKSVLGEDVNFDNIAILRPDTAEDAFTIAELGISSGEFELIVIDSIGAMVSRTEKTNKFDKDSMGQLPKLVGRFIKRNVYDIRTNNIAVLLLNQVRDNVGVMSRIKTYKMPGGHQLQHESAVIIQLSRGEDLKRGEEKVGIMVKFVVKKNKLAPPFRSYVIPLIFGTGIDYYSDLIEFAKLLGVIESNGPYYRFGGETLGQGKVATREALISSQEVVEKIKEAVYNVVNKQPLVILEDEEAEESEE